MNRHIVLACCVLVAVPLVLLGQQGSLDLGRWKNFTDMSVVRGIAATSDSIWAATPGGLFFYVPSTNRLIQFTNSEGLSSNDLTAVTVDGTGRVWVGSSGGFVDVLNPATGIWTEIRSIYESSRVQKAIRTFLVQGDSLFIGTDFGISVLQLSRLEFRDTYANMGFTTQAGVNDIKITKNRIWVATDLGVASALLDAPNLSAPTMWTIYGAGDGIPVGSCTAVASLNDTILVATSSGLAAYDGKRFTSVGAFSGKAVVDVLRRANDIVVLWKNDIGFSVGSLKNVFSPYTLVATNTVTQADAVALQPLASAIWVGTSSKGIAIWTGAWEYKTPNGPLSSLFVSVAVDDQGVLWGASGYNLRGRGFYRYDPSLPDSARWKNFSVSDYPVMKANDYYKVSPGANGSVWVSGWGTGVVEVVGDSIRRRLDQTTTPNFAGSVPQDPNYPVVGGVAVDSKGDTWFVDRTAINGNHVIQLKHDSSVGYWKSPSDGVFTNLVIDQNDTKWIANSEPNLQVATGLYYFNEDSIVTGTRAAGGWGHMTTADALPNNTNNIILSLAVDLDGDVCVGTGIGMMIITDPLSPTTNRYSSLTPLRGQIIQAIAVDAVNNKWVGTKEGVLVVNPDATQILSQYTVLSTNGKLVDDDIRSIAFDQKRGIVYLGTEKGLSSLEVVPVQTVRSLSSIEVGPNPFLVPADKPLMIRNLAAQSSIKIISTEGTLIMEFKAQGGGRAFWNGRDLHGDVVSSGIYFVVAFAENGSQSSTGKVAVIRR
jgi:ligand-binding sensor domain-containing protein